MTPPSSPDTILVDGVAYRITEGPVVIDRGDDDGHRNLELRYRVEPLVDTIQIQVVRDLDADQEVEVVTAIGGQEDLEHLEPGSLAYAQRQAELAGDLDQETEEETR